MAWTRPLREVTLDDVAADAFRAFLRDSRAGAAVEDELAHAPAP
jgi:hypothetical protein